MLSLQTLLFLIIAGICAWRITRLIIDDTIAERPVNFIFKISKRNKYIKKLLTCYYCLGFWVSLGIYLLFSLLTDYFDKFALIEHLILIGALASFPPLIQE